MSPLPDFTRLPLWPDPPRRPPRRADWTLLAGAEDPHASTIAHQTPERIAQLPLYSSADLDPVEHLETMPGLPPFVRGPRAVLNATRPWVICQQTGSGVPEDTNALFRRNLAAGQTDVAVSFDLPTRRGQDSDDPVAAAHVGLAGVAVDSVLDMRRLFQNIPLGTTAVSLAVSAAALPVLAMFIAAGEEQGVPSHLLSGAIHNDISSELVVGSAVLYPEAVSRRIAEDILAHTTQHLPRWSSLCVSGHLLHEAGAAADLEIAYTLANALDFVRRGSARGLSVDRIASRVRFSFSTGMRFFTEVAKLRAARLLWAKLLLPYGAQDPASFHPGIHSRTSSTSFSTQDAFNNVTRACLQAMAATQGQTESLHTSPLDEAIAAPNDFSSRIARTTQQFVRDETDTCHVVDPWGGSYLVESLTHHLAAGAFAHVREVERLGGMAQAIRTGLPQVRVQESAERAQRRLDTGAQVVVGMNRYVADGADPPAPPSVDPQAVCAHQTARLTELRRSRNAGRVRASLDALTNCAASGSGSLTECAIEAARQRATVGEITRTLEQVFGRHRPAPSTQRSLFPELE